MKRAVFALAASVLLLAAACATYRLEKSLDPSSRDFLSKVRYLISKDERRVFVTLPESERPRFIDEFWGKRDPNPDTPENEFKKQYFQRIDEANLLFTDGLEPGWLQDRGRIWILLGQPSERQTYPRGITFYGLPTEIWYYGLFPIVFVDDAWRGNYRLDPDSAPQLATIMRAQLEWKPQVETDDKALDCSMKVERPAPGEARVVVRVPYRRIWMASDGKTMTAILTVALEVLDKSGSKVGEFRQDYPLAAAEEKREELLGQDFIIDIPLVLKEGATALHMTLSNGIGGGKVEKNAKLGP